jgi:uncharacterized protein (DUF302 family)
MMDILATTHRLHQTLDASFDTAYQQVQMALRASGFVIVAAIDLADVLSKNRDWSIGSYKILVVCNPEIAYRAFEIAPQIGFAWCANVVVSQRFDEPVQVHAADPLFTWETVTEPHLKPIAEEMHAQLQRALEALHA